MDTNWLYSLFLFVYYCFLSFDSTILANVTKSLHTPALAQVPPKYSSHNIPTCTFHIHVLLFCELVELLKLQMEETFTCECKWLAVYLLKPNKAFCAATFSARFSFWQVQTTTGGSFCLKIQPIGRGYRLSLSACLGFHAGLCSCDSCYRNRSNRNWSSLWSIPQPIQYSLFLIPPILKEQSFWVFWGIKSDHKFYWQVTL